MTDDQKREIAGKLADASLIAPDSLPYTKEFDDLRLLFEIETRSHCTDREFWLLIVSFRKNNRTGRKKRKVVRLSYLPGEVETAAAVARHWGIPLEQLPYSEEFDKLWMDFQTRMNRTCDRHRFWRALCRARKSSKLGSLGHRQPTAKKAKSSERAVEKVESK